MKYIIYMIMSLVQECLLTILRTSVVFSHHTHFDIICLLTTCSATAVNLLMKFLRWSHEFNDVSLMLVTGALQSGYKWTQKTMSCFDSVQHLRSIKASIRQLGHHTDPEHQVLSGCRWARRFVRHRCACFLCLWHQQYAAWGIIYSDRPLYRPSVTRPL